MNKAKHKKIQTLMRSVSMMHKGKGMRMHKGKGRHKRGGSFQSFISGVGDFLKRTKILSTLGGIGAKLIPGQFGEIAGALGTAAGSLGYGRRRHGGSRHHRGGALRLAGGALYN